MKLNLKSLVILFPVFFTLGCHEWYQGVEDGENPRFYEDIYDPVEDVGQYWIPKQKLGENYWVVVGARSNTAGEGYVNNLQNTLLAESIIGLTALAVNEGRSETMVWTQDANDNYRDVREKMDMVHNGNQTTWELIERHANVRQVIEGYVLYDVNNQESIHAATVAAHVFRSIMVDVSFESRVKDIGYTLKYDARNTSTADAWAAFKDQCNNNALVLIPTMVANQKSYAIAHKLMIVNYNKAYQNPAAGSNESLLKEVLEWLDPVSPVIGWAQGVDEKTFVNLVSRSGNVMVPFDWAWNAAVMSAAYETRQDNLLVNVTNPKHIDYDSFQHYASFLLSDGDNVMLMMNGFPSDRYLGNEHELAVNMSYGFPVANLSMFSSYHFSKLLSMQHTENAVVEYGGGGYYYPDNFGVDSDRASLLRNVAKKIGAHMRQHRTKVLGVICDNVLSENAKQAYQEYINQNDQLIGIVAVQYHPYAGGDGEILWFKNQQGLDIPVVTVKYSIWNHGAQNLPNQGTPAYIASKINEQANTASVSHSITMVHAWSDFRDIGDSNDPLAENINGDIRGVTPVSWCTRRLNNDIKVVNTEELIWHIRMAYRPEQTQSFLATLKD